MLASKAKPSSGIMNMGKNTDKTIDAMKSYLDYCEMLRKLNEPKSASGMTLEN